MTKQQLIKKLKFDMQIYASCKGIKITDENAQDKASRYVEQLSENVCVLKIDTMITCIEKIDLTEFYYEITFKTFILFKNEFGFSDTIFMIVGKDGR